MAKFTMKKKMNMTQHWLRFSWWTLPPTLPPAPHSAYLAWGMTAFPFATQDRPPYPPPPSQPPATRFYLVY